MLVTSRDHVVRAWSKWSRTSAAATMVPIRHGSMLTSRSALKVIFSSALRADAVVDLVELPLLGRQVGVLGFLERHGDGAGLAFVAEAAEQTQVASGGGQGRISAWVRTAVVSCSRPRRTSEVQIGK